jgi:hypothetical protein
VPLALKHPWHKDRDGAFGPPGAGPEIRARVNAPLFPTLRMLGGRAVAGDTFSKGTVYDAGGRDVSRMHGENIAASRRIEGFGARCHQYMYNVLCADGKALIYEDPGQGLVHHPQGRDGVTHALLEGWYCLGFNYYDPLLFAAGDGSSRSADSPWFQNTALDIWHRFDNLAGQDLRRRP